ncbi:EXORDIUM protein [Nymphaea thermarum]|nr:EXORDIUM protein [Nymphaea thermarum]
MPWTVRLAVPPASVWAADQAGGGDKMVMWVSFGMIINIASMLPGIVTNTYKSAYFQGMASASLEAASACAGIHGKNAYPSLCGVVVIYLYTGRHCLQSNSRCPLEVAALVGVGDDVSQHASNVDDHAVDTHLTILAPPAAWSAAHTEAGGTARYTVQGIASQSYQALLLVAKRAQEVAENLINAQHGLILAISTWTVNSMLTSKDVAVEGFCISSCSLHDSALLLTNGAKLAHVWVANSENQYPGQCAWPFHHPLYGLQTRLLVVPKW